MSHLHEQRDLLHPGVKFVGYIAGVGTEDSRWSYKMFRRLGIADQWIRGSSDYVVMGVETDLSTVFIDSMTRLKARMGYQYYQYFDGKAEGVAQAIEIVKAVLL